MIKVFTLTADKKKFVLTEEYLDVDGKALVREKGTFEECMKEFDRVTLSGDEVVVLPHRLVLVKK